MPQPTRKWVFLEQEARRLYALRLSERAIAKKLDVAKSTVTRWKKAGKLGAAPDGKKATKSSPVKVMPPPNARLSPAAWARSIREEYKLDSTDEVLLTLAEAQYSAAINMTATLDQQRRATAQWAALVRQLNLPGRNEPAQVPVDEKPAATEPIAKPRLVPPPVADPRALRAVNS